MSLTSRIVSAGAVLAITAAVFYVSLNFFTSTEVITQADGRLVVTPSALGIQLTSLVAFLIAAVVGLYLSVRLLTKPEESRRGDSEPPSSWRLYLHRLELPPFEEDDED